MSRRLQQLWSALEQVPDLAAVPGEWSLLLGSEYELASRFLLPTQRIARSGKSIVPGRCCVHELRPWKGEYLSVCPDGCETVTLSRDQVVVHRLDVAALGREITEALGLEVLPAESVPNLAGVLRIGQYVFPPGCRFPVCLVFTGEPDQLRCDVDGLAARAEPFVLLVPTRSTLTQVCADQLKRAKSSFLALDELLGQGDDGRLVLLDGHTADGVLADFRAVHVPQPEAESQRRDADGKQAEEAVSMRSLLDDRAMLVGALLNYHKHGLGKKAFVREAATAESLAETLRWTPERVRETFVLLPGDSYDAYRQECERRAAHRCLLRFSRLRARPGKALTPAKWSVFLMTRAVTLLGLAKEPLVDIHRLLARSVTNLPKYGTFKKAVQRAAFRKNDNGEWERQCQSSSAARSSLAQKELAARPSLSARVRPPSQPAQKGAAPAPKVCASCKDDFKPYECPTCDRLIADRCQDCHAEKKHGNLIP